MSTFSLDPSILRRQAQYEFMVANWPERLQRASQVERQLLALMTHPCYRLSVTVDAQGIERLRVQASPGKSSPLTPEARAYAREHRQALIAWVKRTEADAARLRALERGAS